MLEGKSRNRSGSQMGSSKAVYWRPHSFSSSYQQCSTMLSETWGMASTYSIQRRTLQSEDQDYMDTDEGAAIRR